MTCVPEDPGACWEWAPGAEAAKCLFLNPKAKASPDKESPGIYLNPTDRRFSQKCNSFQFRRWRFLIRAVLDLRTVNFKGGFAKPEWSTSP